MISNLPETDITVDSVTLSGDTEKVVALSNAILPKDAQIEGSDIVETVRLRNCGGGEARILKVKFAKLSCRNNALRENFLFERENRSQNKSRVTPENTNMLSRKEHKNEYSIVN